MFTMTKQAMMTEMFELQKARFLQLGYDARMSAINANRMIEMVLENVAAQPQHEAQLLSEELEDMRKAAGASK